MYRICQLVKPTSAYGAQVGTKSCRLHAVDPAVRRLVAVAQSAIRDVVNLFWDWRLPETAWLASLPSKIFATLHIAVNLICGCFCLAVFLEIVNVKMSVPCFHQVDTYAGTTSNLDTSKRSSLKHLEPSLHLGYADRNCGRSTRD